jgi:hypothetical protein
MKISTPVTIKPISGQRDRYILTTEYDLIQNLVRDIIRQENRAAEEKLLNAILAEVQQDLKTSIVSGGSAKAVIPGKEDPETCDHNHLVECIKPGTGDTYDFCLDCRITFKKCPHHHLRQKLSYEAYECLDCHELVFSNEEIDWDNTTIEKFE